MKTITMNPMNPMNLFQGLRYINKKIYFLLLELGAEKVHPCSSGRFVPIFGGFPSIHSYKSLVWMNQMYMDEPLANFKRENVTHETSLPVEVNLRSGSKVHLGSSGSSRREATLKDGKLVMADLFRRLKEKDPKPNLRKRRRWFRRKVRQLKKQDWSWLAEMIAIVSFTICLGLVVLVMLLICDGC